MSTCLTPSAKTRTSFTILSSLVAIQVFAAVVSGAEIRTYHFVADGSLPYWATCGECGPRIVGARADIEGTFTLAFDQETGTGTLLALDDRLVDTYQVLATTSGTILEPFNGSENGVISIIPAWASNLEPPIDGMLTSAGEALRLVSDGRRFNADGTLNSIGTSYTIAMIDDRASFSMEVPIDDWYITVTNAFAVQVVPEPNGCWLVLVSAVILAARRAQKE